MKELIKFFLQMEINAELAFISSQKTAAEIYELAKEHFAETHGLNALETLEQQLSQAEVCKNVSFVDGVAHEYLWFAVVYFHNLFDKNFDMEYLLKTSCPCEKYFYRGRRAVSIKLLNSCGGSISLDRNLWKSMPETNEDVWMVLKEIIEE